MGQLNLPSNAKVYIDSAILIYSVEAHPDYRELLRPLWLSLQASEIEVISSELSLMEVLIVPLKNNDSALVNDYRELMLNGEMQLIPINSTILTQAAQLRATTNLRTPDAIHVATALNTGSTMFLSNDRRIRQVPNLSIIVLQDVLES
ncbi:PIN domain-containing protein [Chroococcus sp. FPU101]|uniref:type II toxin-antitoxin system VapC family toxin n=1 Tax=Chroococcus sp. FPU101 TaxID=1974212 RepID=UPI001A8FA3C0|nr:PIN domain-containing protein [Chroococcus sp. FPU101]GFE71680.1 PilT protein-like [Chroococcus sp. FPU101]